MATYDLRFLDIFVGWPGRSHDHRVFTHNPLFHTLPGRLIHPHQRLIDSYHIIGDSAYPCHPELLTPFKKPRHGGLNAVEKKFNTHLASKRNVSFKLPFFLTITDLQTTSYTRFPLQNVERSFALLLQRFPRTVKLNQHTLQKKIKVVMASCILHNICIIENDNIQYFIERSRRVSVQFKIPNILDIFIDIFATLNQLTLLYIVCICILQVTYRQINQQYRPMGTPISKRMGILKRLQMANLIFRY